MLLLFSAPGPVWSQGAEPKTAFLQALARFSVALDGVFGDEGRVVRSALDDMARGLDEWDATLRASETALSVELRRADSASAARMHVAMGAAYLDRGLVPDALREFESAGRLDSSRADVFMFQGLANAQLANDPARAAAAFRQAAALDPTSPVLAYLIGRSSSRAGKKTEALQAFRDVLHLWNQGVGEGSSTSSVPDAPFIRLGLVEERSGVEPFFPPVLYAEGFASLERGEFAKALEAFRGAVTRDPLVAAAVDPREAMGLAASAFRDGDTDGAVQHLRVAIELNPTRTEPHRLLGLVLLADRQEDEALKEMQLAVRLAPGGGDERAYLTLSDALVELRRYAEAERVLHEAIQAFPTSGRAHHKLGRLYQRQNQALEALGEFEAAVRLHPLIGLNRILQTIGALNAAQQNFEAAADAYSTRVDAHPNDPDAHQALGYTYVRLERSDEALAEFAVALLLNPRWPNIYVAMSQLHLRQGEYGSAADAARRAVRLDPTNKQARYALATALMRLDKPDEARPELDVFERLQGEETAAAVRQMTINGLRREASVRSDNREYERAVVLLRKVLELAPDATSSHYELGLALLKSGQPAEAVEHLEAAARLDAPFEVHQDLAAAYAAIGQNENSQRELAAYRQLRRESLLRQADR
jgi:tetratricopeptide (TPR) repeat protein